MKNQKESQKHRVSSVVLGSVHPITVQGEDVLAQDEGCVVPRASVHVSDGSSQTLLNI